MAQGTLTLTNGSAAVTGSGTAFGTQNRVGDFMVVVIGGMSYSVTIGSIQSPTALTLTEIFYGPTTANLAWDAVPLNAVTAIPYQLGVQQLKALRLMNLESDNWLQLYTGVGNITVNIPDGRQYTGPSLNYFASLLKTFDKYSFLYSPKGGYRIVLGDDGLFQIQDGWGVNKPIPVTAGGTGAADAGRARMNLGLGDGNLVTHGGLRLDTTASAVQNGGVFESRRLSDDGTAIVSMARMYHEVQSEAAKATIHVTNGREKHRYFQFDENGLFSGVDNINVAKQISFPELNDVARLAFGGVVAGASGAMSTAKVQGGSWGNWRSMGAGTIIQSEVTGGASTVWKSVEWGRDWGSCMSTVIAADNNHATALIVGGFQSTFYANGTAQGNWVSASDLRLKANLKRIETPLEKLSSLVGYTYLKRGNLVEDEHSYYSEEAGLIAQDVNEVLPECVYEYGEEKMLGVNYNGVAALLVNGFNELTETVRRQGTRIEELEALLAKK
ncbi:tail fiber domain-containing protein [Enterobacter sp. TMH.L2]